jgi:hypothetical protein
MKLLIYDDYCLTIYDGPGPTIITRGPWGLGQVPLVTTTHLAIVNKGPVPRGPRRPLIYESLI